MELGDLIGVANETLLRGFLTFLRMAAFFSLLPSIGGQFIPQRIRLMLALCMTFVVFPSLPGVDQTVNLVLTGAGEIVVGLALGLSLRAFVFAIQISGVIAAQSTSLSQLLGATASEPLPAMGHILTLSGVTLLIISGFHISSAKFFILSYELFPLGSWPDPSAFAEFGIERGAQAFSLAVTLAAPFIILSIIYNLALGAINRAMPQLMVAFVGAPLITAGGLALLFLSGPYMVTAWVKSVDAYMNSGAGAF